MFGSLPGMGAGDGPAGKVVGSGSWADSMSALTLRRARRLLARLLTGRQGELKAFPRPAIFHKVAARLFRSLIEKGRNSFRFCPLHREPPYRLSQERVVSQFEFPPVFRIGFCP